MATIQDAVNQFERVANAFAGLSYFIYGNYASIAKFRTKDYPVLLIEDPVQLLSQDIIKNKRTYKFVFNFFDLNQRNQQAQNNQQRYQGELELLAWQYLSELKDQLRTNAKIKIIEPIQDGGGFTFNAGTDKLIRLQITLRVTIWGECEKGIFSYDN
jgi:hypothetical protein